MNLLCSLVVTWLAHLIGFGREVLAHTRLVTMALRWASALHIFPLGLGAPPLKPLPQNGPVRQRCPPASSIGSFRPDMASIRPQNNLARSSNVELKEVHLPRNCSSQLLTERNW